MAMAIEMAMAMAMMMTMTMAMTMTVTIIYQTNGEVWHSISLLVPQSWVSDDQLGPIPVSQLQ